MACRSRVNPRKLCWAAILLGGATAVAQAQEQYPKPLIHTPTDHPAARALLITIDGLHAFDLANWVYLHPESALAELTARGVTYTNAHTPEADPAAGLASIATGGTAISTGLIGSSVYDRGGPTASPLHSMLRVNTIFEVVHQKIGPTAWAGEDAATTDLMRGPGGAGLDDSCASNLPVNDSARVAALLHWIDGLDCAGARDARVPALFGTTLTAFATAQRTPGMGYVDGLGTMSEGLGASLARTDAQLARIIAELKQKKLYDTTWIFITAPYAQSPLDRRVRRLITLAQLQATAETASSHAVAHISGGAGAMIWLHDPAKTDAVTRALSDKAQQLGIAEIYSGERLRLTFNGPAKDTRMPDILLQGAPGVLWAVGDSKDLAAFGGWDDAATHVALLVSGAQLTGRFDPTPVPTTQLAPLLLRALGMEKFDLEALHLEHSPALPGIF